jgi:hypothetical protein
MRAAFSAGPETIATIDRRLRLHDGLRTLVAGSQRSPAAPSSVTCLRQQLNRALQSTNPRRAMPRRGTGRLRWWLAPLILLLLLQFGLPDFIGSAGPSGLSGSGGGGSSQRPGRGPGAGAGDRQANAPRDQGEQPRQPPPVEERPEPSAPQKQPPQVTQTDGMPAGPLPEPEAFKDAFVAPLYARPGERREQNVATVEVPDGGGGARSASGGNQALPPEPPSPQPIGLLQAVEEALGRRRIEGGEAAFVRRYFQSLSDPELPAGRK